VTRPATGRARLAAKVSVAVAAALLPLLAMEAAMRVAHALTRARSVYRRADDPAIGFVHRANRGKHYNSLGFRDRERAIEKPAGVRRFLVVGDSVTAGYGVEFEDMFTRKLEARFRDHGDDVEVVNFGVPQYSTTQEVALFRKLGPRMAPDVVVLAYVLNDPTRDGSINEFFERDRARSLALYWIERRVGRLVAPRAPPETLEGCRKFDYYSSVHCDRARWTAVVDAFRELGDLARGHGFRVLVAVVPLLDDSDTFADYRWEEIHRRVGAAAAANGFAVLDLLPDFTPWSPRELKIAPDDKLHPNAVGNEVMAAALHRALARLSAGAAAGHDGRGDGG
jgi:lysophospholipase L1-like esterase